MSAVASAASQLALSTAESPGGSALRFRFYAGRPHVQALLAAGMTYDGAGDYYHYARAQFARFADLMTTSSTGTLPWPPLKPVLTALILSTTSMPSSTLPKTA